MTSERGITIRTIQPGERSIQVVEGEVEAKKKLIDKRNVWLADSKNRHLSTYEAVKKDTMNLMWEYKELVNELNEIKSNLK